MAGCTILCLRGGGGGGSVGSIALLSELDASTPRVLAVYERIRDDSAWLEGQSNADAYFKDPPTAHAILLLLECWDASRGGTQMLRMCEDTPDHEKDFIGTELQQMGPGTATYIIGVQTPHAAAATSALRLPRTAAPRDICGALAQLAELGDAAAAAGSGVMVTYTGLTRHPMQRAAAHRRGIETGKGQQYCHRVMGAVAAI